MEDAARQRGGDAALLVTGGHVALEESANAAGLARALLDAGWAVTLVAEDADAVARACGRIDRLRERAGAGGDGPDSSAPGRFQAVTDWSMAAGADIAILSAREGGRMAERAAHLSRVPSLLIDGALLPVDNLLPEPSRVLGMSLPLPQHGRQVIELVQGPQTSEAALTAALALADALGALPIVTQGCAVIARLQARLFEAGETVMMDGSTPWEVDEALRAFGFAKGPFEMQDLIGLDRVQIAARHLRGLQDPARRVIPLAGRMLELGKLGRKTGAGWYRYPGGGGKVDDPIVADLALEEAHFEGRMRCDYDAGEIRERLCLALINEGAGVLRDGSVASAPVLDLLTVFGLGFPPARGGVIGYADALGAGAVVDKLRMLEREDPVVWKADPLLLQAAETGHGLHGLRAG